MIHVRRHSGRQEKDLMEKDVISKLEKDLKEITSRIRSNGIRSNV